MNKVPICPYCNNESKLVTGELIYPHRKDLWTKKLYMCEPCKAYVGCHKKTNKPLGRLANAELRKMKIKAHAAFDPFWREGSMSRSEAYDWLAIKLKIAHEECHIGFFNIEMCEQVIKICQNIQTN